MTTNLRQKPQRPSEALATEVDYAIARKDFVRWLRYVKILEPPPGGGIIPFVPWPHLLEIAGAFGKYRLIIIVKAKQIGISWLMAAHDCWLAAYHEGAQVLEFSKGQVEARDLLTKSHFIYQHLPPELQTPLDPTTEVLRFPGMSSRIMALPSTVDAGIGQSATKVTMDEADFFEYFARNYDNAAKPTTDAGGQLVIASTVNPEKFNSDFQRWARRAGWNEPGENGFALYFYPWNVRPGRDKAWYDSTYAESMEPWKHSKNYPNSLEEALAPSRELSYFDADTVAWMLAERAQEPLEVIGGITSIWKPPVVGLKYILGGDTAWGQTGSYNAAAVFEWGTAEQVAELHGRLHPNDMAFEVMVLHKKYNHAYMVLERAGEGLERDGDSVVVVDKVVELLKECDCRGRLFYADHMQKEPKTPGWITNSQTRPYMLGQFREAVRNKMVIIRSRGGLQEMLSFIRNEKGRAEAAKGAYDDRPICYSLAWQGREYASFRVRSSGKTVKMPYTW